ncbi:MAG: HAMP domain-containing protein, partial [Rhodoferax sp.]
MLSSIKNKLILGFGLLILLLGLVTVVGEVQLSTIKHFNTELDERAYRLSLAGDWSSQVKLAVATSAALPSLDIEPVKKLGGLVQADDEKRALAGAIASHATSPDAHNKAVGDFVGKLVSLQIADSGHLQAALGTAATTMWAVLVVGLVLGVVIALRLSNSIVAPLHHAAEVAERAALGDLSMTVRAGGNDEVGGLLKSLAAMQTNLAGLVGQVRQGAGSVANASAEIAQGNNDLSARTEQQA